MKPSRPAPTAARQRLFAVLAVLLPVALALALEGGLRLAGYGHTYPLFVPVEGDEEFLRVNRKVVFRFMVDEAETPSLWIRPVFFRRHKTPETFRIVVQGGSTAEGYPYGYGASPAGMLQQRLQRTFPERKIDVVTTAMSAVNTYTLLDFSAEILEQQPDAVVVYAGHNEYLGILGVGSGFSVGGWRPVVLAFLRFKDWRLFQLARGAVLALGPERQDRDRDRTLMATIAADKQIPYGSRLYRRGLDQYRANLRALLKRYRRAGVPVLIGTVVSNERDQPPFVSGHGEGADVAAWRRHAAAGTAALESGELEVARTAYAAAVAADDLHAEGHFGLAQALDALGRYGEARRAYAAARDRDQLRFRAPTEINRILRQVAAEQGAHIVEVEEAFVAASDDGIVGRDLMLEHLHPNLEGYFVMADAFYEAFRERGMIGPWERPISRRQARREMPVTAVDRLYGEYRAAYLTSDWPFVERRRRFRVPRPTNRVEEIARSYYRGPKDWPIAMRDLLEHYRRVGHRQEPARVAVLLAEAFPNRPEDQQTAAELLTAAGRSDAEVYRRRAALKPPAS